MEEGPHGQPVRLDLADSAEAHEPADPAGQLDSVVDRIPDHQDAVDIDVHLAWFHTISVSSVSRNGRNTGRSCGVTLGVCSVSIGRPSNVWKIMP